MMEKLQVRLILEILGRPKEHVTEALNMIVDRVSKEKGVKMLEKHVHEPVPVKDSKDLFTSFTEVIIECENLSVFFGVVFAYMPANIEIIEPTDLNVRNDEFTSLANRIIQRLHNYDAIARKLIVDNKAMREQLGISEPKPTTQIQQPKDQKKESKKPKAKKPKKKK